MRTLHASLLAAGLATAALPAQLSGVYVVGPAGSYANIAAAISALTTSGVAGPVTFYVTANDTGPWTIPAFAGQGAANPVVFEAPAPVTLSGVQPVLTLNGCAFVTFRGFNGTFLLSGPSYAFVIAGGTSNCVFAACDFSSLIGAFYFSGGSNCRIEDSTFSGAVESLFADIGNTGTTVQRCNIIGGSVRVMTIGGSNFTLVDNFITGTSNYGINAGIPGTPASAVNLKIWHNSIYITHPTSGSQYCSLSWYSSAAGTEVVDNVFFDFFPAPSTTVFNVRCWGPVRPALMNYNCLWSNQAGYTPVFLLANQTFAQWQALGLDTNSIQADPLYVAPVGLHPDLRLQTTSPCAVAGTFLTNVLTDFFLAPRTPPVSIGAHENDGPGASYSVFGPGCAGTAGVPSNTASVLPQLGQSPVITFGNLPPPNLVVAALGLSNTQAAFGPLPFDLGLIGAPGCFARVSLDATLAIAGAAGSASFVFPIPNQATLIGFTFYTQGVVFDPTLNPFGFSTSDAATAVVGP